MFCSEFFKSVLFCAVECLVNNPVLVAVGGIPRDSSRGDPHGSAVDIYKSMSNNRTERSAYQLRELPRQDYITLYNGDYRRGDRRRPQLVILQLVVTKLHWRSLVLLISWRN